MTKLANYDSRGIKETRSFGTINTGSGEDRDWMDWFGTILTFPFEAVRKEDMKEDPFKKVDRSEPFRVGHRMKVLELMEEDDMYGVIVKVREGRRTAYLPLCDMEVTSRDDRNFWPVREYVVWFANRLS